MQVNYIVNATTLDFRIQYTTSLTLTYFLHHVNICGGGGGRGREGVSYSMMRSTKTRGDVVLLFSKPSLLLCTYSQTLVDPVCLSSSSSLEAFSSSYLRRHDCKSYPRCALVLRFLRTLPRPDPNIGRPTGLYSVLPRLCVLGLQEMERRLLRT